MYYNTSQIMRDLMSGFDKCNDILIYSRDGKEISMLLEAMAKVALAMESINKKIRD